MSWVLAVVGGLTIAVVGFALGRMARRRRTQRVDFGDADDIHQKLHEAQTLQELSYLLADTVSVEHIAEQLLQYLTRFIANDGALVALLDVSRQQIRVVQATGTMERLTGARTSVDEASLVTKAIAGERVETGSATRESRITVFANYHHHGSAAAIPLQAHGTAVGTVALIREERRPFSVADVRLLSTASTQAAMALSNARFVEMIRVGKEQWEATFDAIADGIALIDETGSIRRANRALASLLGRSVTDITGHQLAGLLSDDPAVLTDLLGTRRRKSRPSTTVRSEVLDRVLRMTAAPMTGNSGWVVVLIEDVTEQKALEMSVIQNEKMAAVGQLVSGVAHELNNPLTSIGGLTEFLLQQPYVDEVAHEHLEIVRQQAERAAQIVRNLLTFARQSSSADHSVSLNEIVQRAVALIAYEMRLRSVDLVVHLDPAAPHVPGDGFQLQQVVLNLVTNAAQAVAGNPPGRARTVTIQTTAAAADTTLTVTDTGSGIPDEARARLFEPFFTTKQTGHGTGLGLSITFGIVQAHGGTIAADNVAGGGATFTVRLPRVTGEHRIPAVAPSAGSSASRAPAPTNRTIILIDDDPAVRRMIEVVFRTAGHSVISPPDMAGVVTRLAEAGCDLVLADPRAPMPGGVTFADWLSRERPALKACTIFLTADVRAETAAWLDQIGCPFFHKPFNVRELKQTADRLLAAAAGTAS